MSVAASRDVGVPAEVAWILLVDWDRQAEWMPLTRVRRLDGTGVNTRLEAVTGVRIARVTDPMRMLEWDPPRRCVLRHEGPVLKGTGTFEVAPIDADNCTVTWREDLTRPPGSRLAQPFFSLALRRFARLAEQDVRSAGTSEA